MSCFVEKLDVRQSPKKEVYISYTCTLPYHMRAFECDPSFPVQRDFVTLGLFAILVWYSCCLSTVEV